ncbi:MAG TPA: hypothetical protein VN929_08180 [Burkholderiales bacterium]|nr:hypothetical protein [Burkholderiales bacterium]
MKLVDSIITCLALLPTAALAAPNEIKIFTDELANHGEHTLETHVNKGRTPWQVMPEYSYGIWRNWEFSLQIPMAFGEGSSRMEGTRAELQYVAPHDAPEGYYWGLNVEVARHARPGIIPIVGLRADRWHFVANPGFEGSHFEPAAKVAYRAFGKNSFGFEHYALERSRTLYFAWDGKVGKSDINLGLGRGLNDTSDRWVLKMIYEIAF